MSLVTWTAPPGLKPNDAFAVRVRETGGPWQDLFVYDLPVGHCKFGGPYVAAMVTFDFSDTVELEVRCSRRVASHEVRPASFGITAALQEDTLTLRAAQDADVPRKFVLRVNDDWHEGVLHVFTNLPETRAPAPEDVDHYFGPGEHHPGTLDISETTGTTVYLAGGAVVYGSIQADNTRGAVIFGRGMLAGGRIRSARGAVNVRLDGFIMTARTWAIVFERKEALAGEGPRGVCITNLALVTHAPDADHSCPDGIHLDAAADCQVRGCFVRAADDLLSVDARFGRADMHDITFEDMVLWCDRAHCMVVGYRGTPDNRETITGVTFRRIEVINQYAEAAMQVFGGDNLVIRDILFEDVRIMPLQAPQRAKLMSIDMRMSHWAHNENGLATRNITFRNIAYEGDGEMASDFIGKTRRRCIADLRFVDCTRQGRRVRSMAGGNIVANDRVFCVAFSPAPAEGPAVVRLVAPVDLPGDVPYASAAARGPIRLNFLAPEAVVVGQPYRVHGIRAIGETAQQGALCYTRAGEERVQRVSLEPEGGGRFQAVLGSDVTNAAFAYFVELACASGTRLREPPDGTLVAVDPVGDPPGPVRDLQVRRTTAQGVLLGWAPAPDSAQVGWYEVVRSRTDGTEAVLARLAPEEQTFACGRADFGQAGRIGVRAVDTAGQAGPAAYAASAPRRTECARPAPDVFLSDLDPLEASTGWAAVERDRNGIRRPLRMAGRTYAKGLGVHSESDLVYAVPAGCRQFVAQVGIDSVQESQARCIARVFVDERMADQSPCLGPGEEPWQVSVPIPSGAGRIRLRVSDGYDNVPYAVVDWANAGFVCENRPSA